MFYFWFGFVLLFKGNNSRINENFEKEIKHNLGSLCIYEKCKDWHAEMKFYLFFLINQFKNTISSGDAIQFKICSYELYNAVFFLNMKESILLLYIYIYARV